MGYYVSSKISVVNDKFQEKKTSYLFSFRENFEKLRWYRFFTDFLNSVIWSFQDFFIMAAMFPALPIVGCLFVLTTFPVNIFLAYVKNFESQSPNQGFFYKVLQGDSGFTRFLESNTSQNIFQFILQN